MTRLQRLRAPLLMVLGSACYLLFTWSGAVGGELDAVSYLLMARYFAGDVSAAVAAEVQRSILPPLYPLLLTLADGGRSLVGAHVLTTLSLLCALFLYHAWLRQQGLCRWQRVALVALFASLPITLGFSLELLSESFYMALSLAALLSLGHAPEARAGHWWIRAGLAIGLAMVCRSVGLALVLSLLVLGLRSKSRACVSAFVLAAMPTLAWRVAKAAQGIDGGYASAFVARLFDGDQAPVFALISNLQRQAEALLNTWLNLLGLFPEWPQQLLAALLGLASCLGMGLRLRKGQPDALYGLFYLGMVLAWPYPRHAERLLCPLLPLLLFYAWSVIARFTWLRRLVPGLLLVALLPAWLFIAERWWNGHQLASPDYAQTRRWYSRAALADAREDARRRELFVQAMVALKDTVPPEACVYFLRPRELALYADRRGLDFPLPAVPDAAFRLDQCDWAMLTSFTTHYAPQPLYPIERMRGQFKVVSVVRDGVGEDAPIITVLGRFLQR